MYLSPPLSEPVLGQDLGNINSSIDGHHQICATPPGIPDLRIVSRR